MRIKHQFRISGRDSSKNYGADQQRLQRPQQTRYGGVRVYRRGRAGGSEAFAPKPADPETDTRASPPRLEKRRYPHPNGTPCTARDRARSWRVDVWPKVCVQLAVHIWIAVRLCQFHGLVKKQLLSTVAAQKLELNRPTYKVSAQAAHAPQHSLSGHVAIVAHSLATTNMGTPRHVEPV